MLLRGLISIHRKFSTTRVRNYPIKSVVHVAFGKYLLVTNTVSSGVLMLLGDLIQQEFEFQDKKLTKRYDYERLGRMFVGGILGGPLNHYYYGYINYVFPKRDTRDITKKLLCDQLVMSPVCIVLFFYSLGLLEGKTVNECSQELSDNFIHVYKVDWLVWPPIQFINFYLVPVRFQVLYINSVTMLYNVFLSYIKHRRNYVQSSPVV